MRRVAILVLGFSLAAASAQAQDHPSTYGSFAPNMTPPKHVGGGTFAAPKAPEPYRAHAQQPTLAPLKPIGSTQPLDGSKPFKPFKGASTYEGPGAFKPYKPPKMKGVYDH